MTLCDDCQAKNIYRFNWKQVCCRVRFLRDQPNWKDKDGLSARDLWLRRWKAQGDAQIAYAAYKILKAEGEI